MAAPGGPIRKRPGSGHPQKLTDAEFLGLWQQYKSAIAMAKATGMAVRAIYARRRDLENRYNTALVGKDDQSGRRLVAAAVEKIGVRRTFDGFFGQILVFSDAHFWPGQEAKPYCALLEWCKHFRPDMTIANGDIFDGARISRFTRDSWDYRPSMKDELTCARERMDAIRYATRKSAYHLFNWGNHDIRFARYLAMNVPEFEGLPGSELSDHIPHWQMQWSIAINGRLMVKHRQHGGVHGAYNNTLRSGWSMVTGHLHRLLASPWADYNGIRWGVDCGTLAPLGPDAGQFSYTEDNAVPWSQGFAVLTITKEGILLEPEFCRQIAGHFYFRGERLL